MSNEAITGEQKIVVHSNGPTWRWIVGMLLALLIPLGGGLISIYATLTNGITRLEERIGALQREHNHNWGLQSSFNGIIREDADDNRERIIRLEAVNK